MRHGTSLNWGSRRHLIDLLGCGLVVAWAGACQAPAPHTAPAPAASASAGTPSGLILMGSLSIEGKVQPEQVQSILRDQHDAFHACQNQRKSTVQRTEVTSSFTIDAEGGVQAVESKSELPEDSALAQCVRGVVAPLRFARPETGTAKVVFQLRFLSDAKTAGK